MKVFVTGATGQLARSLAEIGHRHGAQVVAVGRPRFDLANRDAVAACIDRISPSVVVNAGAYTAVDNAERETRLAHSVNAEGAAAVAVACDRLGIPIIHVSTDYVFDGRKAAPYMEGDPPAPLNAYGRTKLEGERRVRACCRSHVILRTAWLYSPFGSNFAKRMLNLAEAMSEIAVVDDQVGNPTYAGHLADAVLSIACRLVREGGVRLAGTYHAAGHGATTRHGFAEEILRCSRALGGPYARVRPIVSADHVSAAKRPMRSWLDCGALQRTFAITLPPWQAGAQDCVRRLLGSYRVGGRSKF